MFASENLCLYDCFAYAVIAVIAHNSSTKLAKLSEEQPLSF